MTLSAGLSLRAQLAIHSAAAALLGALLGGAILVPIVHRATRSQGADDAAAFAELLAAGVHERCMLAMNRPACEAAELVALTQRPLPVQVGLSTGARPAFSQGVLGAAALLDPGPPVRWLIVQRPVAAAAGRASAIARLGVGLTALAASVLFLFLFTLLTRLVAKPTERLLAATDRVGTADRPLLAEEGPVLGRLGTAFDRMTERLDEERRRVGAQVAELRAVNRQLAEARDAVVRQEKLASVGRLSAGVAHEIGNPLAAILGYLEVLRIKKDGAGVAEYVDRMEKEVQRIDRIVRDLLDFSRPGTGTGLGPVVLRDVIEKTTRLVGPQKRFREVEVRTAALSPDLPAVLGDEHYLRQVLLNLLVNAADAMGGKGTIHVTARLLEPPATPLRRAGDPLPGARVVLEVRDEGPGVPPEHLDKIFDPFFTTKDPGQGTGLGLSICHSVVESFGGAISAENPEGGGALFRLELQVAAPGAGARVAG